MNQRGFGPPPRGGIGNSLFPFVLGGVVGSIITNNNRRPYYYPYPVQYYYPYPYYPYNNYYRY